MLRRLQSSLHSSGGLFYHYLALKHRYTRWRRFRNQVAAWLRQWEPTSSQLIIFGASGGHTLPSDFINKFKLITCIDPDPLAPLFLKAHFPKGHFEFLNRIDLHPLVSSNTLLRFQKFIAQRPGAAILFSNLLGQEPQTGTALKARRTCPLLQAQLQLKLEHTLRSREWASYHDILSINSRKRFQEPALQPSQATSLEDLVGQWPGQPPESLVDHQTYWLVRPASHWAWWNITRHHYHLISFTSHRMPKQELLATPVRHTNKVSSILPVAEESRPAS